MEITMNAPGCGNLTTIKIESDDMAVFDLKLKMQQVHGVRIDDQDLYYNDTCLRDFEKLKDHGIQDSAVLKVRLKYWLRVHGPKQAYRLHVHKDLTLGQVKEMLTDEHGLNMRNMKFIFGDETANSGLFEKLVLGRKPPKTYLLENDDATLGELGIGAETYVKFMKKDN